MNRQVCDAVVREVESVEEKTVEPDGTGTSEDGEDMVFECPNCGAELEKEAVKCPKCNVEFAEEDDAG